MKMFDGLIFDGIGIQKLNISFNGCHIQLPEMNRERSLFDLQIVKLLASKNAPKAPESVQRGCTRDGCSCTSLTAQNNILF